MLKAYLKEVFSVTRTGDAREESYYSCLAGLLRQFAHSIGQKEVNIIILPKKSDAGYPDFKVWDRNQYVVGHIEAKEPFLENLDHIEDTDQLRRYRDAFPNLILTNFHDFRLYRYGKLIDVVSLTKPFASQSLREVPVAQNEKKVFNLLEKFLQFSLPRTYTPPTLASALAKMARFLAEQVVLEELKRDENGGTQFFSGMYEAFRELLISGLTKRDFADLYSQTVTYGLFAARINCKASFNRQTAFLNMPRNLGLLNQLFKLSLWEDLPEQMERTVDDICEILAVANIDQMLRNFYHEAKGKDPVYYFYETFLAEYNPEERKARGEYYTPPEVVSYIIRSINIILKECFTKTTGLASDGVTVLDPAAGTLTFLAEASKLAMDEFVTTYGEGGREKLIREHILQNFYAFELKMAPYVIGHLKLPLLLKEKAGYELKHNERPRFYLTNTLEMEELSKSSFPGLSSLSAESYAAARIKKQKRILVIFGNPPYRGHSYNTGPWISKEIKAYYEVDGKPLNERNPKWLQNDYVKFIRFAQWKIDQSGEGILGFITDHSYLDNPTFRGMRQSLMNSFNEIYVLDLHGNAWKEGRCPDGSKDKNVFDIMQGVAISLFIKNSDLEKKVFHSDIWGLRQYKYEWLLTNDIKTTEWQEIKPKSPFYLFTPTAEEFSEAYSKYPSITDIFPTNNVGIATSRDDFVINFDRQLLVARIKVFKDKELSDEVIRQTFKLKDKANWKVAKAREKVSNDDSWEEAITQILYRPFDIRWIFYYDELVERPRREIMSHMMYENLGLISTRFVFRKEYGFHHAFVTKNVLDINQIQSPGTAQLFPLYLYVDKGEMFSDKEAKERKPNLNRKLVELLAEVFGEEPTPEETFYYIYGVLYSNVYRSKYAESLKIDFPKVPFTRNYELFKAIGKYGRKLVDLHLVRSTEVHDSITKFQGSGDNHVESPRYVKEEKRVYINDNQYFEGIDRDTWQYQIGGYQVLDKWLKWRRAKGELSLDDIKHYCNVVTALKKTIAVQKEIDNLYLQVEEETLSIDSLI